MKPEKQLTLDYFSHHLQDVKNEIQTGNVDPMAPLSDFISAFGRLKEDHVSELPGYVSLFTTLCDILGYKIQAYKSLVYEINQDRLAQFLQEDCSLDDIVDITPWILPLELTMASTAFLSEIKGMLGQAHKTFDKPPEPIETEILKKKIDFSDVDASFIQERNQLLAIISQDDILSKKKQQTMKEILEIFEKRYNMEKVRAFIIMLHLIQDGFFSVHDDGEFNLSLSFNGGMEK